MGQGEGTYRTRRSPLHQSQRREIDGSKGIVADGLVLLGPGARDDVAAEHHHDAPAAGVQRTDDAVPQVLFGIGDLVGDGLLGTGEDDGLVRVLDQVGQCRRRVGQGVGAVADDEAVVEGVVLLHGLCHHEPVLRAEVRAVDAAQRQRLGAAELLQLGQMGQQFVAGQDRPEPLRVRTLAMVPPVVIKSKRCLDIERFLHGF